MRRMLFVVEVELNSHYHQTNPDDPLSDPMTDIPIRDALKDHIKDAVEAWGGQLWPGHLLFSRNFKKIKVTPI